MSAINGILQMTLSGLGDLATADIVTGKPVVFGDKTIVPVIQLSVGLGGGGGSGEGEGKDKKHPQGGKGKGMGGGAGGGAKLTPVALIVKDKAGVRVLKVPSPRTGLEKWIDKIPALVEKVKGMTDREESYDSN